MAGIVARRPIVGIAAGLLFGALGALLIGIETERGFSAALFKISGCCFLFIAAVAVLSGLYGFLRASRSPGNDT
jgi:hypothetical protein